MASPNAGAPVLKYRDVNTETTSPGEVKGLINLSIGGGYYEINKNINNINFYKIIAGGSVYYFSKFNYWIY